MQELLKLIFSNFYVVIVIVGFLFTVLSKARRKQSQSNRMPPFGGGSAGRPLNLPPQPARPGQAVTPPPKPLRAASREQEAQPRQGELQQPATGPIGGALYTSQLTLFEENRGEEYDWENRADRNLEPAGTAKSSSNDYEEQRRGGAFRVPGGQSLKQAFIMSEVLGPPRSKRSLRSK